MFKMRKCCNNPEYETIDSFYTYKEEPSVLAFHRHINSQYYITDIRHQICWECQ